ncbi:MAG: hypothetical protein IKD31_06670 [Clostridia bacterium]|nr:hypothetical protein [Clostridia bacterium]
MNHWQNKATDRLVEVLSALSDKNDCYAFLEDLCTIREIMDMSQRLEVAILLKKGTNYQEINRICGASTATISRVNKCLSYGNGGYRAAIDLLEDTEQQ